MKEQAAARQAEQEEAHRFATLLHELPHMVALSPRGSVEMCSLWSIREGHGAKNPTKLRALACESDKHPFRRLIAR